jgi:hypothetical protein
VAVILLRSSACEAGAHKACIAARRSKTAALSFAKRRGIFSKRDGLDAYRDATDYRALRAEVQSARFSGHAR